jgi:hypothetical protein
MDLGSVASLLFICFVLSEFFFTTAIEVGEKRSLPQSGRPETSCSQNLYSFGYKIPQNYTNGTFCWC